MCRRVISFQKGQQLKDTQGLDYFMESSALTGFNARKVFLLAAQILYTDYMKYNSNNNTHKVKR